MTVAARVEPATSARADDGLPDRDLVERVIARRDDRAFHVLYSRHTPALYAMAMQLTGQRADAEDAVHDAWLRAVDALGRFEWRSSLRTWLTSILLNRIRELDRRESQLFSIEDEPVAAESPADLPGGIDPIDLEAAIQALPPGYRRVLVLHDVEGFTHDDIATLLGVAIGTSKSQLAHARRRLRRALSPEAEKTS